MKWLPVVKRLLGGYALSEGADKVYMSTTGEHLPLPARLLGGAFAAKGLGGMYGRRIAGQAKALLPSAIMANTVDAGQRLRTGTSVFDPQGMQAKAEASLIDRLKDVSHGLIDDVAAAQPQAIGQQTPQVGAAGNNNAVRAFYERYRQLSQNA